MKEELNKLTLIGRTEIKGKRYPIFLERFGLLFSIILTIFLTFTIWNEFEEYIWLNVLLSICFAPLFALSMAEIIGRLIQYLQN
ncbi:MAG: hypothetical protein CMB48_04260 [Euryarchaeota archaeon]|nr:hypothetical protein [Euryarchaeota archaeon]|tara:strand:- start:41 stop:292 length:252 start_codon:yes stop_codon:yes gene_type:complete